MPLVVLGQASVTLPPLRGGVCLRAWAAGVRPALAGPLYLSLDIDCLDPAFAPGTGTPEQIATQPQSHTGQFLKRLLDARGPRSVIAKPAKPTKKVKK